MSSASPVHSDTAASTLQRIGVAPLRRLVRPAVEFIGFWTAVLLPFVLLALVASGLAPQYPELVGGLVVGNLAGLGLGQGYNQ